MKIFGAIVSICLALFLLFEAHGLGGISLERFGYIGAAVILIVVTIFLFVPVKTDEQE
ncbi:MAG: hypothetical protein V7739_14940 [Motiliproteus sp.]